MLAALFIQSCSSIKHVPQAQLQDKWILKSINNRPVAEAFTQKTPYLMFNFDIGQVSGNAGCNGFNGRFTYNKGVFQAPNLVTTLMACIGANEESTYLELLGKESNLSIMNGDLIFSQDNKPVLVFEKAKPLGALDLTGVWKLTSLQGASSNIDFKNNVPTMEFNFVDKKITGNAGCNRYNAPFTLENNVLDVKPLATTRMTCEDIKGETKFVNLLSGRIDIDLENGVLYLRKDNKTLMTFSR